MFLAVGIFIALSPTAWLAGWWLPVSVAGAGLVAQCSLWTVTKAQRLASDMKWFTALGIAHRFMIVPLSALVVGDYLAPRAPTMVAVAVVVGLALITPFSARFSDRYRLIVVVLLLVAGGILAAVSLGITPIAQPVDDYRGPFGVLAAGLLWVPLLRSRTSGLKRQIVTTVTATAIAVLIGVIALYQLGPSRLALSPRPLHDLLSAMDAQALFPWLFAAVILAATAVSISTLHNVWRDARKLVDEVVTTPRIMLVTIAIALPITFLMNATTILVVMAVLTVVELYAAVVIVNSKAVREQKGRRPPRLEQ